MHALTGSDTCWKTARFLMWQRLLQRQHEKMKSVFWMQVSVSISMFRILQIWQPFCFVKAQRGLEQQCLGRASHLIPYGRAKIKQKCAWVLNPSTQVVNECEGSSKLFVTTGLCFDLFRLFDNAKADAAEFLEGGTEHQLKGGGATEDARFCGVQCRPGACKVLFCLSANSGV